jgi:hydroxyethylthiazole kinase-like uncharacterized protein yjeF
MEQSLNNFLPDASAPDQVLASIGRNAGGIYRQITFADIREIFKPRLAFSHKGTYGHALIIAGNENTMGAALLCSKACLHGGAGLTTAAIPQSGLISLNTSMPEVMYLPRTSLKDLEKGKFNAIAIGPGLGTDDADALDVLKTMLNLQVPLVIDADALNLLAKNSDLKDQIPQHSILTPHMKEFDHLFGMHESWYERLQTAINEAVKRQIVIVLKNQFTFVVDSSGTVYINQTGNPAMAQGGMGDVLTGLVAAYTAQGYAKMEAAVYACYVHGKSGDELAKHNFNVTASEVAEYVPKIIKRFIES